MAKSNKKPGPNGSGGETPDLSSLGGFFGGLGTLIEKLAEKGEEFKAANRGGEFGDGSKVKGVCEMDHLRAALETVRQSRRFGEGRR